MSHLWIVRFKVFTGRVRLDKNGKELPVTHTSTVREIAAASRAAAIRRARIVSKKYDGGVRRLLKSAKLDKRSEELRGKGWIAS